VSHRCRKRIILCKSRKNSFDIEIYCIGKNIIKRKFLWEE